MIGLFGKSKKMLSFGLVLQFAFAFLIAKQLENYFKPNYPHANLVKSFAVLNLLFTFLLVAFLLMTHYDQFGEIGFRSRMRVCGVYWAFGFLTVIGLFGKSKKLALHKRFEFRKGIYESKNFQNWLIIKNILHIWNYRNIAILDIYKRYNVSMGVIVWEK